MVARPYRSNIDVVVARDNGRTKPYDFPTGYNKQQWMRPGDASLRQPGELARAGEHDESQRVVTAPAGQAESCFRPLVRRLASTRRPPAVFMRARKPCSFARWRFLG